MDEVRFWLAVLGATVVKYLLSEKLSWKRSLATTAAGIFSAWVFTDPILGALGWEPERYRLAVAAMLALSGENLLRRILDFTEKTSIMDILRIWRGGK